MKNTVNFKPKYPIGGFAPGHYTCKCVTCKNEFMGAAEMVSVKIKSNDIQGIEIAK